MSNSLKGSWIRTGVVAVALLISILLQMETLTHVLGAVLAATLWLAVGSYLPNRFSDYSTAQKIYVGVTLVSIVIITALLVNMVM